MRLAPDARPMTPMTRTKRSQNGKFSETMFVTPNAPTDDTAEHLFRQVARIRARLSRTGDNTEETGLRDSLSLFACPYNAAGNRSDGPGGTGRTLGRSKVCQSE